MPINCALSSWWYDVPKMIGKKITLKLFLFSIDLNLLKHCFNILSRILFACLFVSMFFSVISTVLFLVQTQITV